MAETKEGWQAEKIHSQRVYHYIVGTFSLCGKLGFYMGDAAHGQERPGGLCGVFSSRREARG